MVEIQWISSRTITNAFLRRDGNLGSVWQKNDFPRNEAIMFFKKNEEWESFTLIGLKSDFRGDLNIKGGLRVEGVIHGLVNADSVVLGQAATVKGDITAKTIIVEGTVEGNLKVKEIVKIKSTGRVLGEISTNKISIIAGGVVHGKVEVKVDESKIAEFDPMAKG